MKDKEILKELFEKMLNKRLETKASSDNTGFGEGLSKFLQLLSHKTASYNRVQGIQEKKVISALAFKYVSDLYRLGTIDTQTFEKIMNLCLNLEMFIQRKIDKTLMVQIVNFILFSNQPDISVKEILEYLMHPASSVPDTIN